jgi:hypothetical protein
MMSITINTLNSAATNQMLPERMWWGYLSWVLVGAALWIMGHPIVLLSSGK